MEVQVLVPFLPELLGEHLHTLVRPTEDDALVDDEFGVDGVQGLDLVSFVNEDVVVGEPDEHELVHHIDDFGLWEVFLLEGLDCDGEGGGVHQKLRGLFESIQDVLDLDLEVLGEELISLVQHEESALVQDGWFPFDHLLDPSCRPHNDMHPILQLVNVL